MWSMVYRGGGWKLSVITESIGKDDSYMTEILPGSA